MTGNPPEGKRSAITRRNTATASHPRMPPWERGYPIQPVNPDARFDDSPTMTIPVIRDYPRYREAEMELAGRPVSEPGEIDPDSHVEAGDRKETNSRLLAATGSIAIATLTSRITGFAKQLMILMVLGPAIASSFTVASQIPNMIAELVLGAVLTAIVVPVLVRAEREDKDKGEAFIRRLFTAALVLLGMAALLATVAAPLLTKYVFLSEDGKVSTDLTTALSYLLLPAILFYGLSALFTAFLNTRQVFKPGAWAPVLNNMVVLVVLVIYRLTPGEISLDPVSMGDAKLLTLGIGITVGVIVQAASLIPALRRENISLKPLWGLDDRLRQFGGMAVAIVLYVLISQIGMIFATRISSHADEAGPAIYSQAWLLLQLPYGVLGVTVLTAIMPRLSRNAAAEDTPAVVDDLSVATRLTMITLVPIIMFLTFMGPQVGEALYGYGRFGTEQAERLGTAVSWSAFTLIPYALVLIQLRVFYAREQAWTPTWIVLGITAVKIAFSALVPLVASDTDQVVILLGAANGLGYITGAVIGGYLLHRSLGNLQMANVGKTVWSVVLASLAGSLTMLAVDRVLGFHKLTENLGGPGSFIRVAVGGILMLAITFTILYFKKIPEVRSVTVAVSRKIRSVLGRPEPASKSATGNAAARDDDAVTELIPAVRTESNQHERPGALPYPGPGTTRSQPAQNRGWATESEGARVSDDKVSDDKNAGTSAVKESTSAGATPTAAPRAEAPRKQSPQQQAPQTRALKPEPPKAVPNKAVPPAGSAKTPPAAPAPAPASRPAPRGPKLIPGASVAGGRYRLLAPHGGTRGLQFWEALDVKLDREVALTFVDAEQRGDDNAQSGPQAVLSRTLRLGRINSPGLARVLDVVRGSSGGIVVAEWTPGRSLREMAETTPSPIGAARAIRSLAAAAEAAHRSGGALSIDHPDRVRISINGDAVLAFPATLADADSTSDVRGLGAMLYALITARWPLAQPSAGPVGGLLPAGRDASGNPIEVRGIRPEVPFDISAVATRALQAESGIRTAATVQHILDQASVVNDKTELIPALRLGHRDPGNSGHALTDPEAIEAEKKKSTRMLAALTALGVFTVIVLILLGVWVASFLSGSSSNTPLSEQSFGLTTEASAPEETSAPAPLVATAPVGASAVAVFSPQGTPDQPATAKNAIDGNPATEWSTDAYFQPFPSLKNGVGLMVTLDDAATLKNVAITSDSPGSVVEIRSAPSAGTTLDQTKQIGTGTLKNGVTEIPVTTDSPSQYVLIWITELSTQSGQNQTAISDITFNAAR
ncbi:peptidoglycan biosynthesis protein MviN [Rhodococcus sp. KBS0724]|uniref:murein biosynthesis integral membrane protein MurJ n=1 Tax=Rhodococcus sp. KBS0724 TaxID=1179674 RepID=UPI00110D8DF8|nr:murein biosynthesis integral membrane protein MurJ [Rhodococcus sp. KBS0724]TSD50106.1 peptidoglycan biosynthesis protein MviN [Rhodococcus sp. KBS0724]